MQNVPNIFEQWVHVTFFFSKWPSHWSWTESARSICVVLYTPFKSILPVLAHPGGDLRYCCSLNMSFVFACFAFLAFFIPFLLPTFSLPLANPLAHDTHFRASMDDVSGAETEPRAVVELLSTPISATEPLLAHAAPTTVPTPDSPILFLPQKPSSEGFIIAEPGIAPSGSADNTSDQPPATGNVSTPTSLMMAYYPGWVADTFPPERIDFSRFDWIDFAFAVPDENFALALDGSDSDVLSHLVSLTHENGKKAKLSVGGWGGSK
jgi:hypothetical protein